MNGSITEYCLNCIYFLEYCQLFKIQIKNPKFTWCLFYISDKGVKIKK